MSGFNECLDCGVEFDADEDWKVRCLDCYLSRKENYFDDDDFAPPKRPPPAFRIIVEPVLSCTRAPRVEPTDEQKRALSKLVGLLREGSVVALRGLAGTGKSALIPHLLDMFPSAKVSATTHKAVDVLRSKGLTDAVTVYQAGTVFEPDADYRQYVQWLERADMDDLPTLLHGKPLDRIRESLERHGKHDDREIALENGIDPFAHGTWGGASGARSALIIDEASMLKWDILDTLCERFHPIILVGDHGQLPPVGEEPGRESVLRSVPGVDLETPVRQAADSGLLTLAMGFRTTDDFRVNRVAEAVRAGAPNPNNGPLIVWRNKTRLARNREIRRELGYPERELVPGEPLVCKNRKEVFHPAGLLNNTHWTYAGNNRVKRADGAIVELSKPVFIEDFHTLPGKDTPAKQPVFDECHFQLGYAMTCHSSQGGEWPSVQIDTADYAALIMRSNTGDHLAHCRQWGYTAITRAKQTIYLVGPSIGRSLIKRGWRAA